MRLPRTVVLCYHRIASGEADPFHLCVAPTAFERHLEMVRKVAAIVPIGEVLEPSRSPRAVITFDDGYADNFTNALPIAAAIGVPITVYVTTGFVDSQQGTWWDRLGRLVQTAAPGTKFEFDLGGVRHTAILDTAAKRPALLASLHATLRAAATAEIDAALKQIAEVVGGEAPSCDSRLLTRSELKQLSDHPGVTIGAHTADHVLLAGRPQEEQATTMATGRRELEAWLNRSVTDFAYPFGRQQEIDSNSIRAAADIGFETAVTTWPGSVRPTDDRLRLRRRMVMDWSPARFAAQLARWGLW